MHQVCKGLQEIKIFPWQYLILDFLRIPLFEHWAYVIYSRSLWVSSYTLIDSQIDNYLIVIFVSNSLLPTSYRKFERFLLVYVRVTVRVCFVTILIYFKLKCQQSEDIFTSWFQYILFAQHGLPCPLNFQNLDVSNISCVYLHKVLGQWALRKVLAWVPPRYP